MKIKSINWGDDSAEKDSLLLEYFVTSDSLDRLSRKAKSIVVGRKGSGKSALLAKLAKNFAEQDNIVVKVLPKYNSIKTILNDETISKGFCQDIFFNILG
ncbi:hypothetical protein [Acidocella sp.]|uniref:hypothetical protein n=1 Tax=Acidocella sp. TaxID=50710 RepID=UPI00263746A6|nr:hypothetical protein [Acidocella sp.]MDD2795666.1 hypothetical protein [Acidocella sp.]